MALAPWVSALALAALQCGCAARGRAPARWDEMQPPVQTTMGGDSGAAGAQAEIEAEAERIVAGAEREAAGLDLRSAAAWAGAGVAMAKVLRALEDRCFHDGALGPATAALRPAPFLARLRGAWAFESATRPRPPGEPVALATAIARGLGAVELDPDAGEGRAELRVAGLGAQAKWVAGGSPRVVIDEDRLNVEGPPGMAARLDEVLRELR